MDQWLETKQLPVHFVSAAGVVYKDGKVLLIRSERRGWEFPGGIVEQGEALLDGLRREIFEESGIVPGDSKDIVLFEVRDSKNDVVTPIDADYYIAKALYYKGFKNLNSIVN